MRRLPGAGVSLGSSGVARTPIVAPHGRWAMPFRYRPESQRVISGFRDQPGPENHGGSEALEEGASGLGSHTGVHRRLLRQRKRDEPGG